jgi:hypothetical protein
MKRDTIIMALLAFVLVGAVTLIPVAGIPLALLAALIAGAVAGWWVARTQGVGTATSGVRAGAIVGVAALLGSIVGLTILGLVVGNDPTVQTWIQFSEPHPEARLPGDLIVPLAALAGVLGGLVFGVFDLLVSVVAGGVAGLLYGHNHAASA